MASCARVVRVGGDVADIGAWTIFSNHLAKCVVCVSPGAGDVWRDRRVRHSASKHLVAIVSERRGAIGLADQCGDRVVRAQVLIGSRTLLRGAEGLRQRSSMPSGICILGDEALAVCLLGNPPRWICVRRRDGIRSGNTPLYRLRHSSGECCVVNECQHLGGIQRVRHRTGTGTIRNLISIYAASVLRKNGATHGVVVVCGVSRAGFIRNAGEVIRQAGFFVVIDPRISVGISYGGQGLTGVRVVDEQTVRSDNSNHLLLAGVVFEGERVPKWTGHRLQLSIVIVGEQCFSPTSIAQFLQYAIASVNFYVPILQEHMPKGANLL
jgi:hypothetical protein